MRDGWHPTFDDSISLPDSCELHTLRDAGNFIAKLPRAEHDAPSIRLEEAASVQLAMDYDTNMIQWLFDFRDPGQFNELSPWADMIKSIEDARRAIAAFIEHHYKIEQKESDR